MLIQTVVVICLIIDLKNCYCFKYVLIYFVGNNLLILASGIYKAYIASNETTPVTNTEI